MNETKEEMKTIEERTEVERKSDRKEMKQEIRDGQKKIQGNLKKTLEVMMNMNHTKTDTMFRDLTETIEKRRWDYRQQKCPSRRRQGNSRKI
jgi:DNA-binding ferritin-like protein